MICNSTIYKTQSTKGHNLARISTKWCFSDVSQSYQLQEAETVASPQVIVVSQPEISSCVDSTSAVSQLYRYLTSEKKTVSIAQVQSHLNKLTAEAAVEHSSSLLKDCEDSDIQCARCLKRGSQTELRRCAGCKSFSYCSKVCQRPDWPSHKRLCKSIQSLEPLN